MNKLVNTIKNRDIANDVIYTPKPLAEIMIDLCGIQPGDKVLDPSKGGGIFYNNLPECNKDYCEITEDRDFYKYDKDVDIIVGNPPYSLWTSWLEHTVKLNPKKFCYIFGQMNLTTPRLKNIYAAGYKITKFHITEVKWWFGRSFVVVFEKTDVDNGMFSFSGRHLCDICNKSDCKRGQKRKNKKWGPNECSNLEKVNIVS